MDAMRVVVVALRGEVEAWACEMQEGKDPGQKWRGGTL